VISSAVIAVFATVMIAAAFPAGRLYLRTTIPGRVIRFCLGEPGATQWVNDAGDRIEVRQDTDELQRIGDQLFSEFIPVYSQLPKAEFSGGKAIPLDRLPEKYRKLGGWLYGDRPQLILELAEGDEPATVYVSWGHGRQCILIFATAPAAAPYGFFVRKLNDRIYVMAGDN